MVRLGLTPSETVWGSFDHLTATSAAAAVAAGNLDVLVAKSDAAGFMLQEALEPIIQDQEVTIGYSTTQKATFNLL